MNLHPKNIIFPAIAAACLTIGSISIKVNSGFTESWAANPEPFLEAPRPILGSLSPGFPDEIQQWKDLIEENAADFRLDPNLIAAVMLQESGGNPSVISSSGAVGLMQVMPRDGIAARFLCINGPCFSNRPTINELTDPVFNVHYGSKMLSELISKNESIRDALKFYGPADVGYYYADIVQAVKKRFE